MKESVAIAKEADAKKEFSPTKSDKSIHRVQHEPEMQLGSLRGVIDNIRRDGGTPSVDSIAAELSSMTSVERAPVLLALQRTHGNRYMQRVVAGIQAELKVGQPGDIYEQEADRVAKQVMGMPEPQVQRQPEEEKKKKKEYIQTKEFSRQTPEVIPDIESRIQALKGGGQPLPESTRAFFEPRFGYDFSQVHIHTDAEADTLNRELNARAFTIGRDIFFRQGGYTPGSSSGRELLAHELTHVVQQTGEPLDQQAAEEAIQARSENKMPWATRQQGKLSARYIPSRESVTWVPNTTFLTPDACVLLIQRDLREEFHGQWSAALVELNMAYAGVGGVIDRQKGAVGDFRSYAGTQDPPSLSEQILVGGINLLLGAALPGVGNILKTAAQRVVRSSLRGSVGGIIDSMVDAGKGGAQNAVRNAWSQAGRAQQGSLLQFSETQRRALDTIARTQVATMNRELARLRATEGEADEWEAADALCQSFRQSINQAYYEQFNKMTDIWFTMQTRTVGLGARPGVLQITLTRRYPHQGSFSITGGNLVGGGAVEEVRNRLARRALKDIDIPKVIRMNGQMGWGIADCNWYIEVTGQEPRPAYQTISAPRSGLVSLMAGPQRVTGYGGHRSWGWPWLAAFHLGLEDLDHDDPRNSEANRSAGAREVWDAIKNIAPGSIGSSTW